MRQETLPVGNLAAWARLNNVEFNGAKVGSLDEEKGSAILAISESSQSGQVLIRVPQELVLSLENVWIYAKSDRHLSQVLEAIGDFSRTARGAILTFLFLQLTNNATKGKIGVSSPFSEYVKFLPTRIPIPTFWNDQERLLLTGTSLEAALESKLKSLDREFTLIREKTISIDWCRQHWWDVETAVLMFADWRRVDALFRSRAVDLPGTGHAMVPCIDMANHASGNDTTSLYDTDSNGDAILTLRDGQSLTADSEVTITYGDEKGACEVLFSYGFIECSMTSARELFLDLEIPDDDPLKLAKKKIANSAPGFRLYESGDSIGWEGPFIWLIIVNEEDGLGFKVLQKETGERELQASWKDTAVSNLPELKELMEAEEGLWDIFNLRAVVTLQSRIEQQLLRLEGSKQLIDKVLQNELVEPGIRNYAWRLRELEETLMLHAYENFESKKTLLYESPTVQDYLSAQTARGGTMLEDDFS